MGFSRTAGLRTALGALALLMAVPAASAYAYDVNRAKLPRVFDGAALGASLLEPVPSPANLPARSEELEVVGRLEPTGAFGAIRDGQIADLSVYKGYAYLNSWDSADCTRGGTYVVDIRNPSQPTEVGFIPADQPYYHGEGAHVVPLDTPQFQGDILAVNNETYGSNLVDNGCAPADKTGGGFDLYDVSDPTNPIPVVRNAGDTDEDNDPATPPRAFANSYHSVFVWQDGPRAYLVASDNVELTDVDIFDITDPSAPQFIGDHDLVELFPEILDGEEANGSAVFHHDVVVKHIGGRPVMKADYWDAGYVQLDVSDPANPVRINDTTFAGEDPLLPGSGLTPEGNAHQGEFSHDNQFLLAADEDFGAFRNVVRGIEGRAATAAEGDAVARISDLPDGVMNGPSVFVGDACDPATIPAAPADDADPNTEDVALIERGGLLPDGVTACGFANKFDNAQAAGWDALIIFNQVRPDDGFVNMLTGEGGIPGVQMRRVDAFGAGRGVLSDGDATPAPGTPGPDIEVGQEFDGWGYAHLYDAQTAEHLDAFAIPEALDPRFATDFGDLSIHEFATDPTENLAYSSYYAGGIRVLRFSRENGLEQVGAWIDDGGSNFWGVEQFTTPQGERLIAGSDRDYGLVILRYTGPGAAQPPSCSDSTTTTKPRQAVSLPLTCTDANGNPLTRRIIGGPSNGSIGPIEGDSVLYTPNAGFTGSDSVQFVASDGAATSEAATSSVTVGGPRAKPSNRVKIRIGRYRNGRVRVVVTVAAPGYLRVGMRANLPRGRATAAARRLDRVTKRPRRAGPVEMVLRMSRAERKQLQRALKKRRGGALRARINTAFTPTGGSTGRVGRTLVIRRR